MRFDSALSDLAFLGNRLSTARAVLDHPSQSESHIRSRSPDAVAFPETIQL